MQWLSPELTSRLLSTLDDVRFVALCNALLSELASERGIGRECLALNLHTKEPDGGIDARCENSPTLAGRLIPRAFCDYQFKSGRSKKSATKLVEDDILAKTRVVQGLRAGHAFVYVAAWDQGDMTDSNLASRVRAGDVAVDDGQIVFIGIESLTSFLSQFPSLVAEFIGVDDSSVESWDRWSRRQSLSNEFQRDADLDAQLEALRLRLEEPASTVRVVGSAGDGKTRMVLEALRESALRDSVLYAPQVEGVAPSLISHLLRTPDVRCTLVVDEVDERAAERLIDDFSSRPSGVRLLLIGLDASGRAQPDSLQVEGLSEELLAAAIGAIVPGLPQEVAVSIARDCERSPKLAVLIANRIRANPGLARSSLLGDGSVRNALEAYLPLKTSDPEWAALSTMSLLMRLGWSHEVEPESTSLFSAVDLNPVHARRAVEDLHDKYGIAPLAGRFRYVSPSILADHLASRQLGVWTREYLSRVIRSFTPSMADSFARRARRLAGILRNAAIVDEVILGPDGPFRNLADLESGGISFVVNHLAAAFPLGTLSALERVVGAATTGQLREAKRSRRDVVWALEQLLWPEALFERTARLLLRLAIAENETWANNASRIWTQTFQTVLGRTEASWPTRLRSITEAARHDEAAGRVLAAQAIEAAFKTGHLVRTGNPPSDVPGMPEREWRPTTYGEWYDSLVAYLEVLSALLHDPDPIVSEAAATTLSHIVADLFHLGERVINSWSTVALSLSDSSYEQRSPILHAIDSHVELWQRHLSSGLDSGHGSEVLQSDAESQREAVRDRLTILQDVRSRLAGRDFTSRFRGAVSGPMSFGGEIMSPQMRELQVRRELLGLAEEVLREPTLMDDQWQWLLDEKEYWRSERWLQVLGEVDSERHFERTITDLSSVSPRAIGWLSLYELAFARTNGLTDHVDRRAEELIATGRVSHAFDLMSRVDPTQHRLEVLEGLLERNLLAAVDINALSFTSWPRELSVEQGGHLLAIATSSAEYPAQMLPFLTALLYAKPDSAAAFQDIALRILAGDPPRGKRSRGQGAVYEWEDLANRYVQVAPLAIGVAALKQIEVTESAHEEGLVEVLARAFEASDKAAFFEQVLAPALLEVRPEAWWMRQAIAQISVSAVESEYLLSWVSVEPEKRARVLADVVGPPSGVPSELHASLLERYDSLGVGNSFAATLMSGTWSGQLSAWWRSKLTRARAWMTDERPAIREWATKLARGLEEDLRSAEAREAEERFE